MRDATWDVLQRASDKQSSFHRIEIVKVIQHELHAFNNLVEFIINNQ